MCSSKSTRIRRIRRSANSISTSSEWLPAGAGPKPTATRRTPLRPHRATGRRWASGGTSPRDRMAITRIGLAHPSLPASRNPTFRSSLNLRARIEAKKTRQTAKSGQSEVIDSMSRSNSSNLPRAVLQICRRTSLLGHQRYSMRTRRTWTRRNRPSSCVFWK
jgi:hypothetical protein